MTMQDVGFSIRPATPTDLAELRRSIAFTLSHPDVEGRPPSLRAAVERGEVLVLEYFDRRSRATRFGGFIEFRLRVDDTLTIRDIGSEGGASHVAIVKHLLTEALESVRPVGATLKVRRDADTWNEILGTIPGFQIEGPPEYRRPHYLHVWEWRRDRAAQESSRRLRRGRR